MDIKDAMLVFFGLLAVASVLLSVWYANKNTYLSGRVESFRAREETKQDIIKVLTRKLEEAKRVEDIVREVIQLQKEWPEGVAQPVQREDETDLDFQIRINGYVIEMVSKTKMTVNQGRKLMGVPPYVEED